MKACEGLKNLSFKAYDILKSRKGDGHKMNSVLNKIIIFTILSALTLIADDFVPAVFVILLTAALCAYMEYINNENISTAGFLIFLCLCIKFPGFICMIPLYMYDLYLTKRFPILFLALIPTVLSLKTLDIRDVIFICVPVFLGLLLKSQTEKFQGLYSKYISQRDDMTELSIQLEKKIKEQIEKQDVEVNIATLNERNRIAREIHDNVGHLLTSSILQIGAIMAVTKEENIKASLTLVKTTLDEGMNSIRNSIHNLHEDSVDLEAQLMALISNFKFCDAKLKYEIDSNLKSKYKYAVIAIVKEALANVIKHSNAKNILITLYEHPKLIQLIIIDDGNKFKKDLGNGMGLESMRQRVNGINGIINIDTTKGFKIFISFPKDL